MKLFVYEARSDETEDIRRFCEEKGIEWGCTKEVPSLANAGLAEGCDGVSFLGQGVIDRPLMAEWKKLGVRFLSTRTIGFNHISLDDAKKLGLHVCNACYPPTGVADYTVMLILMCLRHYKQALWRGQVNDFSLFGLQGRELHNLTVGVMGSGRIGKAVLKELTGFGCRLLAWDAHRDPEVEKIAEYVDFDTICRESDVISLHMPLTDATKHIINDESIGRMKDGVVIINCARGALADMEALIRGIESEKIGALGLDVVEGEEGIAHVDHRVDILINRDMAYLKQFRNVVMTQHMAFYTDEAVRSMVISGIGGLYEMAAGGTCRTMLV